MSEELMKSLSNNRRHSNQEKDMVDKNEKIKNQLIEIVHAYLILLCVN